MTSGQPATPGPPAGRYGDRRSRPRPLTVLVVVVLAVAFVGWVVWAAIGASGPRTTGQVTSFEIRGAHATWARVAVNSGDHGPVACEIQALDSSHGVVGVTTARVRVGPSGEATTEVTIRTRDRAVTAVVDSCSRAGRGSD